ncbi:MAG: helix-turn-helix domain-containing protein [Bacilli bacterium]
MNKEKMGLFLSELRKERNLTLQDAGEIFLVSFQAISKWERGESVPDVAILEQLAKFYNVSIEEIINGERKVKEVKEEKIEEKDERISTEQKKNRIKL